MFEIIIGMVIGAVGMKFWPQIAPKLAAWFTALRTKN
jgi:hypothetical protein